jgi:hypothetical protein
VAVVEQLDGTVQHTFRTLFPGSSIDFRVVSFS